jgi:hypothetical protein
MLHVGLLPIGFEVYSPPAGHATPLPANPPLAALPTMCSATLRSLTVAPGLKPCSRARNCFTSTIERRFCRQVIRQRACSRFVWTYQTPRIANGMATRMLSLAGFTLRFSNEQRQPQVAAATGARKQHERNGCLSLAPRSCWPSCS